jgi:ABC-type sugar transport system ATPase subunit
MRGSIEFREVSKAYGVTLALDRFSFGFTPGRIHALMGKNGSGKSTAIKILAGATQPTEGQLIVNGEPASFAGPQDAFDAGVVTVHQELSLVPSLSVAENIFMGRMPVRRRLGIDVVDWKETVRRAGELLAQMGVGIDPRTPVSRLSVGQQQMVEIVKAMGSAPSVLLLDEPTSALATREVQQLFDLLRRLRQSGVTMIYITHRMSELFEIADTCTVLRDGRLVGTLEMADATPAGIVEMMFGDVARAFRPPRREIAKADPVLSVRGLGRAHAFEDISFDLHRGEILGFAGLLGSGRSEVLRAIFGADPHDTGTIVVDGEEIPAPAPPLMKAKGLGYTPENRKEAGLVQPLAIHDNLLMASLARIAPGGFVTRGRERPFVAQQVRDLAIKAPDPMLPVSSLSGGNQQKVVIGNWLNTRPKIMFFDEPSRGVDVQAKQQIFEIIWAQAAAGLSSIFVSSELEEVLEVCDRVLVMHHGRIVAERFPASTTLAELYEICMRGNE